jgi:hypothetical protein
MIVIGGFTRKNTATGVTTTLCAAHPATPTAKPVIGLPLAQGPTLFAIWNVQIQHRSERLLWAFKALGSVLVKASFYVFWLPALIGVWWFRRLFRDEPGARVLALICGLLGVVLYRVAHLFGYLGERHLSLILLCGVYWAAAALLAFVPYLAEWLARVMPWANARCVSLGLLLVLTGVPLAKTLEPLHADRAGFRAAGCWIAQHSCPGDAVKDPYTWAHYYAGRVFTEGSVGLPAHTPPVSYVVWEESGNLHPHLPEVQDARGDIGRGRLVQSWPVRRGKQRAEVQVYEVAGVVRPFPPR